MRILPRIRSSVELRARRQQRRAVLERPAVILRVRNLHAIGAEGLERGNHRFEVIDILPMNDEIYGEGDGTAMGADLMLAGLMRACRMLATLMFANPRCQFEFVRVGARSGNPIGVAFARILKTELDVVKTRFHQLRETLARQADSRGDQIRVEACAARAGDQLSQIRTR